MIKLLTLIILTLSMLFATGDPMAKIELKPIATTKDGYVLFSTYAVINKTGSYSCANEQYGWLAVHSSGAWDEMLAFESMDKKCIEVNATEHKRYKEKNYNLKNPDEPLESMGVYGFDENSTLIAEYSVLELKANQSCFQSQCIDEALKQRTVLNHKSIKLLKPIRSSFYYKGVALFQNFPSKREDEEERLVKDEGALFDIDLYNKWQQKFYGVREPKSSIDGLVLFDAKDFKHAGQTSLNNLMHKVNAQKSFYSYCFHMYRTDCFMHEDFKIHGFSKSAFAYTVYEGMDDAVDDEYKTFMIQDFKNNNLQENVNIVYEEESIFKNDKYHKTKRTEKVSYDDVNYSLSWLYKNEDVYFNPEHPLYRSSRLKNLLTTKLKKYNIQKEKNLYLYNFPLTDNGKIVDFRVEKKSHDNDERYSDRLIDSIVIYKYINGKKVKKLLTKKFGKEEMPLLAYEILGYIPIPNDKSHVVLVISYLNRGWEGPPHVTHFELLVYTSSQKLQ